MPIGLQICLTVLVWPGCDWADWAKLPGKVKVLQVFWSFVIIRPQCFIEQLHRKINFSNRHLSTM